MEDKEEEIAAAVSEAVKIAEEAVETEALQRESEQVDGGAEAASFYDKSVEELPNMVIPDWRLVRDADSFNQPILSQAKIIPLRSSLLKCLRRMEAVMER